MTCKIAHKGVLFIDFLQFVQDNCCKVYMQTLQTYDLKNDITNKDVTAIFYHTILQCIISYFTSLKTHDKKIFYVNKTKLQKCCLVGDNDLIVFLQFFIKFIKTIKTKLNLIVICENYSLKKYVSLLDTDVVINENFHKALAIRELPSEKVYKFLEKCGLKQLSKTYKQDINVKFWLK